MSAPRVPAASDLQYHVELAQEPDSRFYSTTNSPHPLLASSVTSLRDENKQISIFRKAKSSLFPTSRSAATNTENRVMPCLNPLTPTSAAKKEGYEEDPLLDLALATCTRNKLGSTSSNVSAAQCRICFSASGEALDSGKPVLVHPCACDGSIRFCHPECLLQWVRQSGSFICELCKTRYHIKRSGLKRFTQWRMPPTDSIDWIHMVIFFFSVCFIVGSIVWMTWLGLGQRLLAPGDPLMPIGRSYDPETAGTLGDFMVPAFILYSIIDVLFLFIAGMELIFTISPLAKKWYRMNQKLIIENFDTHAVNSTPRCINSNIIAASVVATDNPLTLSVQASIPCVNEERERIAQEHNSLF